MDQRATASLFAPGFPAPQREEKVQQMHSIYSMMMAQACLRPLQRGVSGTIVMQTVGMMAVMQCFAPDFKEQSKGFKTKLKREIEQRLDSLQIRKAGRTEKDIDLRAALFDRHSQALTSQSDPDRARAAFVGSEHSADHLHRWARNRLEKIERRDRADVIATPRSRRR